ncbi:hypothetical protein [Larkinella arboricola]|uniref:Small multi-drug export protein n=1 Tax=Larkinella arboricola TaxID=643671 RepID=A0A327X106_LARAB|nr:hypothetical protein [Larkinella arboricola]RAJ97964.1 hypothetical protein LX87_02871 [Larkinella arboricola]
MEIAKYLSVLVASMVKFIGGPVTGVAVGLSWVETWLFTAAGMMASVVLVTYAGAALRTLWNRYRPSAPRRFTARTRLAVRVWKRSGMVGIAFLTPLLLTPIGGTILAVSFRVSRSLIFSYMLISALFWGVVFTLIVYQLPDLFNRFVSSETAK